MEFLYCTRESNGTILKYGILVSTMDGQILLVEGNKKHKLTLSGRINVEERVTGMKRVNEGEVVYVTMNGSIGRVQLIKDGDYVTCLTLLSHINKTMPWRSALPPFYKHYSFNEF